MLLAEIEEPMLADEASPALADLRARLLYVERQLNHFSALFQEKECLEQAISALEQIGNDRVLVTIWQAARDLLQRKTKPMTAKQITDALLITGVQIEGKHRMESVRVALTRKPEIFEKLTDGRFHLKER
jgi:hypothetical protein